MYYSYGDAQKMRHMLKQSAEENGTSPEQMQHNTDSLNAMVKLLTILPCAFGQIVNFLPDFSVASGAYDLSSQHNTDSLSAIAALSFTLHCIWFFFWHPGMH